MKTAFVEDSLYRWLNERVALAEQYADAVHVHRPGLAFPERTELWIFPRITGFTRRGISRQGDEFDTMALVVSCNVKNPAGGREDPLELSKLVDRVRLAIDATERAGAFLVYDDKGRGFAKGDFGSAQESRTYQQSVSVGGITVPGVDSAVLTVAVELSPVRPRVTPLAT